MQRELPHIRGNNFEAAAERRNIKPTEKKLLGRTAMKRSLRWSLLAFAAGIAVAGVSRENWAQQPAGESVRLDQHAIGGVVTGAQGPEAGVWVIAETSALPTKFVKIVVTDERGRYVIPDLPPATYDVWVRGYGLVDSPKMQSAPGKVVDLKAAPAPDPKAAAQYYPALFWYAM